MALPHVVILGSQDGPDWTRAVIAPVSLPLDCAAAEAIRIMDAAKRAHNQTDEDGWMWEDLAAAFQAAGWIVPEWSYGPNWDEEIGGAA